MKMEKIERNHVLCAIVKDQEIVIKNPRAALDLLISAKYEMGTKNIIISRQQVADDFFAIDTGFAEKVLQRYMNNNGKLAIYESCDIDQALLNLVHKDNCEDHVFFTASLEEAIEALTS